MASYTYPGVYITEPTSSSHPITGVATSIAAFVGYTATGIDNRAELLLSFSDYERLFGGLAADSELSYAVQQFFQNGGSQAYVVRTPRHGADPAQVIFGGLTFKALSSGAWANGQILIDIDFANVGQQLNGTVAVANASATVTGNAAGFKTNLAADDWLVFSIDPTQTPYQILSIASDTSLTLTQPFNWTGTGSIPASGIAVFLTDPLAFNLTVTDLVDGTVESFPLLSLNSNSSNFVASIVNDPDNGSELVSVSAGSAALTTPLGQTGLVGNPISIPAVNAALASTALSNSTGSPASVAISAMILNGTGTAFTTSMAGQQLTFAADSTKTPYTILSVQSPTQLTLTSPGYTGAAFPLAGSGAIIVGSSTPLSGAVAFATVIGTLTTFTTSVQAGQQLVFATDTTPAPQNQYTILSVQSDTQLTLTQNYAGTAFANSGATVIGTIATAAFTVPFSVTRPTTPPAGLPIEVTVFAKKAPLPQTVAGLASQLQKALNAALAVQLPGASVVCSVAGTGAGQAIRVNATIPQYPDAIITLSPAVRWAAETAETSSSGQEVIPTTPNGFYYTCTTSGTTASQEPIWPTTIGDTVTDPTPNTGTSVVWTCAGILTDPLGIFTQPTANSNVAHYALGTGNGTADSWGQCLTSAALGSDGSGLPWTVDLIGDPGLNSGIYALTNVDIFNLLSIPDATRALPGDPNAHDPNVDYNAVYSAAIALCDAKRALLLIDPPPEVNNILSAIGWKTNDLIVNDENGACFFPRLRLLDQLNPGMLRTFAPSGVVAGVYATTDSNRGVWKAPAGTQATLNGVQSLVYKMTDAENGELNPLGVNCFRTFPVYGSILWGARTLVGADAEASPWKYVPVRRTALFIEQSLYQGTQWVVFEPNDEPLWASIRLNVGSFMQTLFVQGFFQGSTPTQAYFVKCDSETTTQADIDAGIVNILVGFAPLKPAEFVVIQIQQMAGSQPS